MTSTDEVEKDRRILVAIHAAFFLSVVVYALLVWFLTAGSRMAAPRPGPPGGNLLEIALGAIALAEFVGLSVFAQKALDPPPDPSTPSRAPLERVRISFLLRFAAAEAIALLGTVLGLLGGEPWKVALFFSGAIGGLLSATPTRKRFALAHLVADPDLARQMPVE